MDPEIVTIDFAGVFSDEGVRFEGLARYDRAMAPINTVSETVRSYDLSGASVTVNGVVYDRGSRGDIAIKNDIGSNTGPEDHVTLNVRLEDASGRGVRINIFLESTDTDLFSDVSLPGRLDLEDYDESQAIAFDLDGGPDLFGGEMIRFTTGGAGGPPPVTPPPVTPPPDPAPEPVTIEITPEGAREVALLYEALLDRDGAIDAAGLNFWIDALEGRLPGQTGPLDRLDLVERFFASEEFTAAFGDIDALTSRQIVELFYLNVLDRPGETAGVEFWTGVLDRADYTPERLAIDFALSVENLDALAFIETLSEVEPGVWDFA